jgi:hypothetical protein
MTTDRALLRRRAEEMIDERQQTQRSNERRYARMHAAPGGLRRGGERVGPQLSKLPNKKNSHRG